MLEYLGDAERHGAALALGSPVVAGCVENDGIALETGGAEAMSVKCDIVVNSAGFNAQAVARSTVGVPAETIPPTHYAIGHYYIPMIQGPRDHGIRGLVNLFGIESPGLTSSLAIGDYVADLLAA